MLSDTTCPRPNMQTCEGLQQRLASADKEASQIRVRFLTVNIGTMTGKSREVAKSANDTVAFRTGFILRNKTHLVELQRKIKKNTKLNCLGRSE